MNISRASPGTWRRPRSVAMLLALLAMLVLLAGCGREVLYSNLDEQQANEVIAALMRGGIDADKQVTTTNGAQSWKVMVDKQQLPLATEILTSQGLPRAKLSSFCDVFKAGGFVASSIEDKGRYRCALDQSIADTLRKLDGVVDASVEVAIPDKNLLSDTQQSASASVVIVARPDSPVLQRETDVKAIVKDAVGGLTNPDQVTVKFSVRQPPPSSIAAAQGRMVAGMRGSDLGPGLLITVAVLAVLAALFLLWRSRSSLQKLVTSRGVPGPGFRKHHDP